MRIGMNEAGGIAAGQASRAQLFPEFDEQVRAQTRASIAYYAAHPEEVEGRLQELDHEWGVERWLQLNSAALSLGGLALALTHNRKWLILPAVVQGFFLQHGIQGFCPPLILLRKLGIRTVSEIEAEREALKAMQGDRLKGRVSSNARPPAELSAAESSQAMPAQVEGESSSSRGTLASTRARVSSNTASEVNAQIHRRAEKRIAYDAQHPELIDQRLSELDDEWDIERVIEVEGPITSMLGLALGWRVAPKWLAIPWLAQSMMVLHALQGFYPLVPILRRMGLRTEQEISAERYALKALRGDFRQVPREAAPEHADTAFAAAQPN